MNMNRRDLFKSLMASPWLLRVTPLGMLVDGFVRQMYAQEINENNLVNIMLLGGPSRWMYDLPLRPNGEVDPFLQTQMQGTAINQSNGQAYYKTFLKSGLHVPHLWGANIPTSSGGITKADYLLDNTLMIRGLNYGADGHGSNRRKFYQPVAGFKTLAGILTDVSKKPIPSSSFARDVPHLSKNGGTNISVANRSDALSLLMKPFNLGEKVFVSNKDLSNLIDQAIEAMEKNTSRKNTKRLASYKNKVNARAMFKKNFGDLNQTFSSLQEKYTNLISTTYNDSRFLIDEIDKNDQHITVTSNTERNIRFRLQGVELDEATGNQSRLPYGTNLKDIYVNSRINDGIMARNFAFTEFIMMQGISQATSMNLFSPRFKPQNTSLSSKDIILNHDAHETGAISSAVLYSKYYQSLNSCLHEFVTKLKQGGLFKNSVIKIGGDFNRVTRRTKKRVGSDYVDDPNSHGAGADHGWNGSNVTLISGKINKLAIVGNIKSGHEDRYARGCWGQAAHMKNWSRELNLSDVTATTASLLGVKSPVSNAQSLISTSGSKVSVNGEAKNV